MSEYENPNQSAEMRRGELGRRSAPPPEPAQTGPALAGSPSETIFEILSRLQSLDRELGNLEAALSDNRHVWGANMAPEEISTILQRANVRPALGINLMQEPSNAPSLSFVTTRTPTTNRTTANTNDPMLYQNFHQQHSREFSQVSPEIEESRNSNFRNPHQDDNHDDDFDASENGNQVVEEDEDGEEMNSEVEEGEHAANENEQFLLRNRSSDTPDNAQHSSSGVAIAASLQSYLDTVLRSRLVSLPVAADQGHQTQSSSVSNFPQYRLSRRSGLVLDTSMLGGQNRHFSGVGRTSATHAAAHDCDGVERESALAEAASDFCFGPYLTVAELAHRDPCAAVTSWNEICTVAYKETALVASTVLASGANANLIFGPNRNIREPVR